MICNKTKVQEFDAFVFWSSEVRYPLFSEFLFCQDELILQIPRDPENLLRHILLFKIDWISFFLKISGFGAKNDGKSAISERIFGGRT